MLWEAQFLQSLQAIRSPFLDEVMRIASLLGEKGLFGICVGLLLLIFAKTRRTGFQVLMSMLLAFIFANLIVKNIVGRVRPYDAYAFLEPLVRKPSDSSFPSGHTTNVFAAATAIFLEHKRTGIVALVIASLVSFSRLYNCVHYPTDVLAGIVVGVGFAVLVHYWLFPACENGVKKLKARKQS